MLVPNDEHEDSCSSFRFYNANIIIGFFMSHFRDSEKIRAAPYFYNPDMVDNDIDIVVFRFFFSEWHYTLTDILIIFIVDMPELIS